MKNRSFEIHSVTLKKKVYKIEIPEVAEKGILFLLWKFNTNIIKTNLMVSR